APSVVIEASSSAPAVVMINDLIYINETDTSVEISGDAGKYHIFAVAGVDYDFTLQAVEETAAAPANSKFIGIITWDGSQITNINSSLSNLILKESQLISSPTTEVTLSDIEYND